MRATFILLLSLAACRTSSLGACAHDTDCPDDGACSSEGLCVVAACPPCPSSAVCQHGACVTNDCTPACSADQTCQSGVCVGQACTPACDSSHTCDSSTRTCVPVTAADLTLTPPPAFATSVLHASAFAHAPGGVASVRFDVSIGGAVAVSAAGQAGASDPSLYTADLSLSGLADGAASVTATMTYGAKTLASPAAPFTIDQTPPAVVMQSDGRTTLLAAAQIADVRAQITDTGSGVAPASVALKIAGHADIAGTAAGADVYAFAVPIDDSIAAAGASASIPFSIAASDVAGNVSAVTDAKAVLDVDRDAPAFGSVQILTAPDFTDGNGRGFYEEGATPLSVQATITDGAGVDPASVCLRVAGETGACAHAGTAGGAANAYTFSLPRPPAAMDGTIPLDFTLTASDALAAALSGASQAEHQGTSEVQHVFFDNQPPAIAVTADTAPYARSGAAIVVTATISDPTGVVTPLLVSGAKQIAPSNVSGSTYSFPLAPADAPAGVEGAYAFSITARDNLGHSGSSPGSRVIDGAPPALILQIYKDAPDGGVVTYPAATANTGWTGNSFVYSDTVHVAGSLTDVSGIDLASLHVDGLELDGGVTAGVPRALGCTAGATSCSFDVQVALNDAQNGAFHTRTTTVDAGVSGESIPSGLLQLTIDSRDQAKGFDGTPAKQSGTAVTPARATRFLWRAAVGTGAVSGLAVHPDGDVIVTTNAASGDTLFDLAPDQPAVRWQTGSGLATPVGAVAGQPAIGAGDGASAAIYLASSGGNVYAFGPDGGNAWTAATSNGNIFAVGPAVDDAAWTDGGVAEQAMIPDSDLLATPKLWAVASATSVKSVNTSGVDSFSSPMVFANGVWFGTGAGAAGNVTRHVLAGDGSAGAAANVAGVNPRPYWGVITDGASVYAATHRNAGSGTNLSLHQISNALAITASWTAAHLSSEPALGVNGHLLAPTFAPAVSDVPPSNVATGATTAIALTGVTPRVPLQGSDGHLYLPESIGVAARVEAYDGALLSWQLLLPSAANLHRAAAMDCSGRLFVGDGSTVYALITDDRGLADTAWPNLRRDARNTGNASAPKYGIRTAAGCTQ